MRSTLMDFRGGLLELRQMLAVGFYQLINPKMTQLIVINGDRSHNPVLKYW
jgi:hypothetical protein